MKGQRLFIRPVSSEDGARLDEFYRKEGSGEGAPTLGQSGLIGFLVGEIAVHLCFAISRGEMEIVHIWVARELRRKRVARVILDEAMSTATKLGLARLAVRKSPWADEPFRRLGFIPCGERLVRDVKATPI